MIAMSIAMPYALSGLSAGFTTSLMNSQNLYICKKYRTNGW